MTIREAYQKLSEALSIIYDRREATIMADMVITHITGLGKTDRILHGQKELSAVESEQLRGYELSLLNGAPIQYVLGEAWFASMKFYVNESVLIPRPETEELVEWIIQDTDANANVSILDIGTGSGCIPISLKKALPNAQVHALDISPEALSVARRNAENLHTAIHFHQLNILDEKAHATLPTFDCIVSNPPYIRNMEKQEMHANVLQHEPHLALFVPDEDPLLFYREIAAFASSHLTPGGKLYFEINEALGTETSHLLQTTGFKNVHIRKDLQGKDRMIQAY